MVGAVGCRGDVHCDLREPCGNRRRSRLRALDLNVCCGDVILETFASDCERHTLTPVAGARSSPQLRGEHLPVQRPSRTTRSCYIHVHIHAYTFHTHAHSLLLYGQTAPDRVISIVYNDVINIVTL